MKNASAYGLPDVDLPPVDFKKIRDRIRSVIDTIQHHDSEERFCGLGAKVLFGDSTFEDPHTLRFNGSTYSAKNWVIATGSSAAIPPIEGLDKTPYITNRDIFSLERLPASLIILGGGPIGTEMSQAFTRLGAKVTVVDMADQILTKEDKDMADPLMEVLRAEGVDFHLNVTVVGTKDLGNEKEVLLRDSDGRTYSIKGEMLLLALGRKPNINGLGLEEIGVEFDRSGIQVDARLRTRQKHIYGAGDVIGGYQFTHAAGYEGGIVVSNAIFHLPRKADYTYIPWCTYTDPELASIGMNEKRAKASGIKYSVWTEPVSGNDRSLAEGERTGKVKMILDEKEKPIGVQMLGPHAGELIGEWVAAFNGKVKLATLAGAIHPYPTIGEINKKVVGNYFAPKIFSEKVQKGLKFFFNLKGRACELPEG